MDANSFTEGLHSISDLVDNTEFHLEEELKENVAKKLEISPNDLEIG